MSEKLPKWHFLIHAWNLKFFGPNDFIWVAIKVPFFEFIQKMCQAPSSSVQVLIWEDKLDYLKNPSQDFKNYFCFGFLWSPSNAEWQNWRVPIFLRFNLVNWQCEIHYPSICLKNFENTFWHFAVFISKVYYILLINFFGFFILFLVLVLNL